VSHLNQLRDGNLDRHRDWLLGVVGRWGIKESVQQDHIA